MIHLKLNSFYRHKLCQNTSITIFPGAGCGEN